MDNNPTYDKAFLDLKQIVDEIEDDDIKLDTLAAKVLQANNLVKYCETKLRVIEGEVKGAFE